MRRVAVATKPDDIARLLADRPELDRHHHRSGGAHIRASRAPPPVGEQLRLPFAG